MMHLMLAGALLATGGLYSTHASAEGKTDCELRFSLKGWAALYKHAEGTGVISCNNGKGKFSDVMNTNDLFGDYAQGEANAALVKGGTAQVLTKGTVSLALAGAGEGVDLGISFGKFTISRAK